MPCAWRSGVVNFLEARRLVTDFHVGEPLPFLFALSGTAEPFVLYLRAAAAKRGRAADVRLLPFNTLAQAVRQDADPMAIEVFLLMPWDFVPEADWRSGVPESVDEDQVRSQASETARLLARRSGARMLYVAAAAARAEPKKVLVTDLDNVLWRGLIAEDGVEGIAFDPVGVGYRHFVYQSLLRRLRREGTLLAAVSRNDPDVARAPFETGRMLLREADFVAIIASYHPKSAQIRELAQRLNLGLDSFVFVDDNPVEVAEVSLALPGVRCVAFPQHDHAFVTFVNDLANLFPHRMITAEDRERTDLYRRRLEGIVSTDLQGADLTRFLRDLKMTLTIHDRGRGDRTRAVQLINKTNQFNLNGHRVTDEQVRAMLEAGGRLFGAVLADRTGNHGEVLTCLVASDSTIASFVMSCRVLQRRVEYAFLAWLAGQPTPPVALQWESTARNEPFRQFLSEVAGPLNGAGPVRLEPAAVAARYAQDHALFTVCQT